jgi:hypothetical protein
MAVVLAYLAASAVTKADSNILQGVRRGDLPSTIPRPPLWIGLVIYLQWGLLIALAVFDWKFAILLFLFKFILSFLGVLQIVGSFLLIPFLRRRT